MSILKLKDPQGNWIGVPTIKGDKGNTGNGISSAILNDDYTLTLTFTNGTTYTTPSIRGEKGEKGEPATDMEIHICSITEYDANTRVPTIVNPNSSTFYLVPTEDGTSPDLFTEWVYVNNAWEMFGSASVDLSGYLTDVQINGTSIVSDGVANVPIASNSALGAVKTHGSYGLAMFANGIIRTDAAVGRGISVATDGYHPIVPLHQHESTFYGLAKASGDTTQSASSNAVGNYTDEAKSSIQNMLGITDKYSPKEWMAESETELVTNAHSVGDLFYIGETLYKVIADLNAGDAINVGVNVEEVNVNDILNDYATKEDVQDNVSIVEKSASGAVTSFSDGADDLPLKSLVVDINPIQDLSHGDPSPENICPINGWMECNLNKTGVNIWNKTLINGDVDIDVISGVVYTVSAKASSNAYLYLRRRAVGTSDYSRVAWVLSNTTSGMATFTPEEGYIYSLWSNSTSYSIIENVQIELGSTATDYAPYQGTIIPIDWETEVGTVYGGSLDVLSGVLRVDRLGLDGGDLSWAKVDSYNYGNFYVLPIPLASYVSTRPTVISSSYKSESNQSASSTNDCYVWIRSVSPSNRRIYVKDTSKASMTAEEFRTAMTGVQFVYELAEPIEIQLTPHEVNSLLGVNNIWADTGNTSVEYFSQVDKDLIDYIETSLKPYAKEEKLNDYVSDVQIDGSSIVTDGVANIPYGSNDNYGLLKASSTNGIFASDGVLSINNASESDIKGGIEELKPLTPNREHMAVFYGLAKASGDSTQSASSNAVGTYTNEAKASIKSMLGVQDGMVVNATLVSGTQYTIDSTYDDIKTALSIGKTVVVMTQGMPMPYVGNVQIDSAWYLAFGISTTFNRRAVLTGFLIPETYQNIAIWMEEFADIPDVQIDGTSIVTNSVANIPIASANKVGVVKINAEKGIVINGNQELLINYSSDILVKNGTENYKPLVPSKQHVSTFYGLAKAAGADMSASSNAVGTYTDEAKTAIKTMLGVHDTYDSFIEEVTGTDVTITGQPSYRYNCGELYSLTVTPPSSGTIDIRFTSGSTPTVLTLPSTVKMPEWWVEVEANTIYEMCITDGIYCGVMTWAI